MLQKISCALFIKINKNAHIVYNSKRKEIRMYQCPECGNHTVVEVASYNANDFEPDKTSVIVVFRCENCGVEFDEYYE